MPQQTPQPEANGSRLRIVPEPGSRLEQLLCMHDALKARAKEAKDQVEACVKAIENEIATAHPGVPAFDIQGSAHWPALRMTWAPGAWRVDSKTMKKKDPVTYVRWAVQGDAHWELRPA